MEFNASVDIGVSPQQVWAIYTAVEQWPDWTGSVTTVTRLDPAPLTVGSRVRIKQPRFPAAVWTVTELAEGKSWTWVSIGPGVRTSATHEVTSNGDGTTVRATLRQEGAVGTLLGRLAAGLINRYLEMECEGIKERAERDLTGPHESQTID